MPQQGKPPAVGGAEGTSCQIDGKVAADETTGAVQLTRGQAVAVAPLIGIGCKSGDTVAGLSGVRRTRGLALVFVDAGLSPGTVAELRQLERHGTRVLEVAFLRDLTTRMGREDLSVVGIKRGSLADGIEQKLVQAAGA